MTALLAVSALLIGGTITVGCGGERDHGDVEIDFEAGPGQSTVNGPYQTQIRFAPGSFPTPLPLTMRLYAEVRPAPPQPALSRQLSLLPDALFPAPFSVRLAYDAAAIPPEKTPQVWALDRRTGEWVPLTDITVVPTGGYVWFRHDRLADFVVTGP